VHNIFAVIIGSEILNRRRVDKHFDFLSTELLNRGYELSGSFVIKDEPSLIEQTFKFIKDIPNSIMFSFGGIGATPDDYTREVSAKIFRDGVMEFHNEAKTIIIDKFQESAYPYRVNMAKLPIDAKLLYNPISGVPAYYLDERFFFTPGFPEMAKPMILEVLERYFKPLKPKIRFSLKCESGENDLIEIMQQIPSSIELSSLPKILEDGKREVILSIASTNEELLKVWLGEIINFLKNKNINFIEE